jgi:indole-3-glycerol phosphate synthase
VCFRGSAVAVVVKVERSSPGSGALADLRSVRRAVDVSVLRKDFMVEP